MKRCWYSFFLFLSLSLSLWWTDGDIIYGKHENIAEVSAGDSEQIEETDASAEMAETLPPYPEEAFQESAEETEDTAEHVQLGPLFPEHFEGVLFIGDSRTVGLFEYGQLEEADVFANSGMSVFQLWDCAETVGGRRVTLEELLSEKQYETIHLMLGINELGYPMDSIVKKYRESVAAIQGMQPQADIVLGANLHVTEEKSAASPVYNNQRIDELNQRIESISQELKCTYVDVNEKFDDGNGCLAEEYSADGSHVLGKYYADWVQWLREKGG